MSASESGWYADPAGRPQAFRWWDGARWTRWLSRDNQAPEPAAPDPAADETGPSSEADHRSTDRAVATPWAVALMIGAVLLALIAAGAAVALSSDRLPTGPAIAPPPAVPVVPETPVTFDPGTRAASAQELRAVLPGPPYRCAPPSAQTGLFSSAVSCSVAVHADYNAKGDDWYASQVFGVLDENLVEPGGPGATVDKLASAIATAYYVDERIRVEKRSLKRLVDIAPEGRAVLLVMDVHYTVKGLDSRYDHLAIGLFQLADGEFGTWLASTPNDAPKKVARALDASSRTVRAQ